MPPKKTNIEKTIPEELIEDIKVVAGRHFKSYQSLLEHLREFITKYNKLHPPVSGQDPLVMIDVDTMKSAIWGKPKVGFSLLTVNILCLYASGGKRDWNAYGTLYPKWKDYGYTFPNEDQVGKANNKVLNTSPDIKLKTYLNTKMQLYKDVFLPFAKEQSLIPIEKLAIPTLKCQEALLNHAALASENKETNEYRHQIVIEDEIEIGQKMLITGEGGLGKTTACKILFTQYAQKLLKEKDIILPIFIELGKTGSIKSLVEENFLLSDIRSLNEAYIPLFIFDGLDERGTAEISLEIQELLNEFDDYRVIVTSRFNNHHLTLVSDGYQNYELEVDTSVLPRLILKTESRIIEFERYMRSLDLPQEIQHNNLLFSSFVVHYSQYGEWTRELTKGSILKSIIEDSFIQYWELARSINRDKLPSHYAINNVLSLLAIVTRYPNFFLNPRTGVYAIKGKHLRNSFGVNKSHLLLLCSLCTDEEYNESLLLDFLLKSTIISRTSTDLYLCRNTVVEDYFLCRGLKICIEGKPFSVISEDHKLVQELSNTIFNDLPLASLTAGIIENPDEHIRQVYDTLEKCNNRKQCNIQTLFFISSLIKLRTKEITDTTKKKVIDLFIGFSRAGSDFLTLNYEDSTVTILLVLLASESELVFDYTYNYFIEHYKEFNFDSTPFWKYFVLFPEKINQLTNYDFRESLFKEYPIVLTNDYLSHLHTYHAKEMFQRYCTQYVTGRYNLDRLPLAHPNSGYLTNEYIQAVCVQSLSLFWDSLKKEKLDNREKEWYIWFMDTITKSMGGSKEYKIFSSFSSALFYSCHDESVLEEFLERILYIIVCNKETDELNLDIEFLTRRIAINRHFTNRHTRVLHKIISAVANMSEEKRVNAYRMWSKNIKIKNLLIPTMARQFRSDINSDDNEIILNGLGFFRSIFYEINEEDKYILLKLIRHDDSRIRRSALRTLTMIKLSDTILDELIDFIFDANIFDSEYLIEKSIALSCLFKANKYYSSIAFESNMFEPLLMVEILKKKNRYIQLRNPNKEDDFIKSITVGLEYRSLVKELLEIASGYSIPFLISLREFTFKQDEFLYADITKGIYEIRTRSKRISLFIKKSPDFSKRFAKLKERINIPSVERIRMLSEIQMQT